MTNNYIPDVYDIEIMVQIEHNRDITMRKLADNFPFNKDGVNDRITELRKLGLVKKEGVHRWTKWHITKDGRKWLIAQGYLK